MPQLNRESEPALSLARAERATVTPDLRDRLLRALPELRAFAISLCGNTDRADDFVQETMVLAIANIHRFDPGTNLEAWLFTILRNQFYTHFRTTAREVEDPDGRRKTYPSRRPERLEELRWDQREALLLVGVQGLSYEEAAKISGASEGTLKTRVRRARMSLAEMLKVTDPEDLGSGRVTKAALRAPTWP